MMEKSKKFNCYIFHNVNTCLVLWFVGLSPRVQQNGSNTLPRASHHSAVSESPVKHGSSFSQRSQIVGPSVPGSNGSRRNSNSGVIQTTCGNVTDSGTPSSTPSVPRRCSVGLDGTTKSNGRGNQKVELTSMKSI